MRRTSTLDAEITTVLADSGRPDHQLHPITEHGCVDVSDGRHLTPAMGTETHC